MPDSPDNYPDRILTGGQVLDVASVFSTVVVMPYTSRLELGQGGKLLTSLSLPSEIALRSAVEVYRHHRDSTLVLPGETTYKIDGCLSTTDLMVQEAISNEVSGESLVPLSRVQGDTGRTLDNTYLQVRAVAEFLGKPDPDTQSQEKVLTIAFEPHLKRVMKIMRANGVQAHYASVESILAETEVSDYDEVMPYIIAGLKKSERIKNLLVHNKGYLLNLLSYITGPGYLDIIEAEGGDYKLEDGLARTQQKKVLRNRSFALTPNPPI
jgi:hypothetical protein